MRVLIIGGTNFIGPHVVRALDRRGAEITVYHRGLHEPPLPASVRHVHHDRATLPYLHFPAELTQPPPDVVLLMFPVGGDDTRAAAARFTGAARRMVTISSGDVYRAYGRLTGSEPGPPDPIPLDEDAPLREHLYPYRASAAGPSDWTFHYEKILAERGVMGNPALPGTVLRLPAVYGPGDPYHRLRPYIKRIEDGRSSILVDEVQASWRWSHGYVENVADAIALAAADERSVGRIYNLGEDETPTVAERIRQIGRLENWTGKVVHVPAARLPSHLKPPYEAHQDLVMDTRRFRSELGFVEVVSREEGIRRTIAWERTQPHRPGDPGAAEYASEDAALA
jgi:nucleoside-diphosphate-sugar epimerase